MTVTLFPVHGVASSLPPSSFFSVPGQWHFICTCPPTVWTGFLPNWSFLVPVTSQVLRKEVALYLTGDSREVTADATPRFKSDNFDKKTRLLWDKTSDILGLDLGLKQRRRIVTWMNPTSCTFKLGRWTVHARKATPNSVVTTPKRQRIHALHAGLHGWKRKPEFFFFAVFTVHLYKTLHFARFVCIPIYWKKRELWRVL